MPCMGDDQVCPKCGSDNFDGWDCKNCKYALPEKARKAHPKVLSKEEADELRKKLFGDKKI